MDVNPGPSNAGFAAHFAAFPRWCARNPLSALLLAAIAGTLVYFYGFVPLYVLRTQTTWRWSIKAWNGEQDYCSVVPLISLYLFWHHREKLSAAPKLGSNIGIIFVATGILLFVLGARCVQPRMAVMSVPFLVFGSALYLWGPHVARIILFPCAFLFFMVPVSALEQNTAGLQAMVTALVGFVGNIAGLNIQAIGTTITAADGKFNFQVAEGCSGIRSLAALTMLTAIYVHLTHMELWKKITTFMASIVFAIIGNAGRIFTIIVVARFISVDLAGGKYHHISGFISFPFALLAMIGFSKLLNIDLKKLATPAPAAPKAASVEPATAKEVKYDY